MNSVHILSPELISKIAAGEVIERPASVIKELIENSLDAGADSIELALEDAGKKLIRLRDTGSGITLADVETIFQRHATSKIQSFDDLFNLHSLGFRGEALYSIAAVADVILKTRHPKDDSGWEIHVRGGKRLSLKPASHARGTEITVKELFFNTPARRKFLKSNLAEMNQTLSVFTPYTLLYPQCRFALTQDEKILVDLIPTEKLPGRVAAALSLEEKQLLDVVQTLPEQGLTLRLILGDINLARSRRDLQFIFVNGRPVQSKNISFHMNEAYRLILPPGKFPAFCAYLSVPAENVDVNIHPTKREVKIKDEHSLGSWLRHITESALMGQSAPKMVTDFKAATIAAGQARFSEGVAEPSHFSDAYEGVREQPFQKRPTEENAFPQQNFSFEAAQNLFGTKANAASPETLRSRLKTAKFVGIFINKFLLFESGRTLLVMDQHAAQERITFERLIQQLDKGQVEVQQLLTPTLMRLTVSEMLVWEDAQSALEALGFATTQFDATTLAAHSHPALIQNIESAVRNLLAGENPVHCDHATLARRACRASTMAGDALDAPRAGYIREHLLACRDPFTCPHGRPTVIEVSENFIDKQFLRT